MGVGGAGRQRDAELHAHQVGKVVASDAFADAWVQANRLAHAELLKALTGKGSGAVRVDNDT